MNSNRIYSSRTILKTSEKIKKLGNKTINSNKFLMYRFIITILVFLISLYYTKSYIYPPILGLITYFLIYYIVIDIPYRKRIIKLEREALEYFEILALTLENNRNLEKSLEITTFNIDSELSLEFQKCLFELKFGKSLNEALINMQKNMPSETINSIILSIVETNNFGGNIIEVLRSQVDLLREKQLQYTREQINKIPNKISAISVLFIVPLILLMIFGPMILKLIGGIL